MALSEQQFQDWLEDDSSIKCTLVEVTANIAGVDTVIYLSSMPYNTGESDIPANTSYLPILKSSLDYKEALPLSGIASLSYGDVAVYNNNGELDVWMDYVWRNRPIRILIGDVTAIPDDFTVIYSGVVSDIAFSDRNTVNISIRSLLEVLNTPVSDVKIGGTVSNAQNLRPLVFGEVHNISPVLIDAANLTYMVHNGSIESIIEVRDNGVPLQESVSYTVNPIAGTFTLLRAPVGTITCSVQGEQNFVNKVTGDISEGTWSSTVSDIILLIIRKYGSTQLQASEIDLTTFRDFQTLDPEPVGIYLNNSINVISVCQELANSIGAQFTANREGKVTLLKLDVPVTNTASRLIDETSIVQNSFAISAKPEVMAAIKLAYCKNWTVQTELLTGLPEAHKLLFSQEYLYEVSVNETIKALYKLTEEPSIKNTLLLTNTTGSITAEASRLLTLWSTPRYVYKMQLILPHINIKLGEMVILQHTRFGLAAGKSGQVVSVNTDWQTGRVNIEVLV